MNVDEEVAVFGVRAGSKLILLRQDRLDQALHARVPRRSFGPADRHCASVRSQRCCKSHHEPIPRENLPRRLPRSGNDVFPLIRIFGIPFLHGWNKLAAEFFGRHRSFGPVVEHGVEVGSSCPSHSLVIERRSDSSF